MTTWMQNRSDLAKLRIGRFSAAFLLRGISAAHPVADYGRPSHPSSAGSGVGEKSGGEGPRRRQQPRGTFALPLERHWGEELRMMLREEGAGYTDKAHNQLVQVAATTGLLGLAAYLWIFASYFPNAYRRGGWTLLALSGGVLAYVLGIQTSFSTIVDEVALWAVLGASVAVMRLQEDLRSRDHAPFCLRPSGFAQQPRDVR